MAREKNRPTPSDRKIRYAVIGAGNIAQVAVLPAFANAKENSVLAAVVTSDAEKQTALAKKYGLEHFGDYDDLERVLTAAKIDAAYIALPNHMHREYTERCAKLGVHVLCEKPMAVSVDECNAMIKACDDANVKLMIAYRLHFEEANLEAVEVATSGQIGDVRLFSSVFSHDVREGDVRTDGKKGGGALFDIGIYSLNAARMMFRSEPEEVIAFTTSGRDERSEDVDEMTGAMLRFSNGRQAQFLVSQAAGFVAHYRIVGTKGDLVVDPAFEYTMDLKHKLTIDGKTKEKTFGKRDQFAPELLEFSRCILEDDEPECSGLEGLADIRIIEAMFESAATGKAVKLAPFSKPNRPDLSQEMKKPPVKKVEPVNAPAPSR